MFSFVGTVEVIGSMLAIPYTYALPALLAHHFKPGMVYVILAGFGVLSIPFLRWEKKKVKLTLQMLEFSFSSNYAVSC